MRAQTDYLNTKMPSYHYRHSHTTDNKLLQTIIILNRDLGLNGEQRHIGSNIIPDCSIMPDAIKCIVLWCNCKQMLAAEVHDVLVEQSWFLISTVSYKSNNHLCAESIWLKK